MPADANGSFKGKRYSTVCLAKHPLNAMCPGI
jgi:hypothetical protein